ncbi:MAG: Gfo/Idh/MocA family oxidoreductase [Puniceicoccales bacterium]|jgi:predicted dehydrogenase|nr:Gfo/Idh/MocA family oxidoreductase [Puniceicoccales bacterium]
MIPKLRCGVVGVGHLGQHHARIYNSLSGCELVGICDVHSGQAKKIAKLYGCEIFPSVEALGEACDAVSVVVPTDKHCEVALELLNKNCHLLIEKPLCSSLEEASLILSAAKKNDSVIQVGHIEHYNPVMEFLCKTAKNPMFITADRLAPYTARGSEVGVVLDLMIHDLGVILELVHSKIEKIDAVGVKVLSASEDISNARLRFENGCVANINASRVSEKKVREIRIFQENTYISLDFMNQAGHMFRKTQLGLEKEIVPIAKDEPLQLELESFMKCVACHETPKVDVSLGYHALEVAIEITNKIQAFGL